MASAAGDRSSVTAAGDCSNVAAAGDCSNAAAAGDCSNAAAAGDCSNAAAAAGDCSAATAGNCSAAAGICDAAAGDCSAATATGDCSAATATGNCSAATATGDCSAATATGICDAAAGNCSAAAGICTLLVLDLDGYCTGDESHTVVGLHSDGFRARELAWAVLPPGMLGHWGRTYFFDDRSGGLPQISLDNVNVTYMNSVSHLPLNPVVGQFAGERARPSRELGAELRLIYEMALGAHAGTPVQILHAGRAQGMRLTVILSNSLGCAPSDLHAGAVPPLNAAAPCCNFHQSGRGRCPSLEVRRRLGHNQSGAYRSPSDRSVGR